MPRFEVETGALRTAAGTATGAASELNRLLGPFENLIGQAAEAIGQPDAADAMLGFGARWEVHLLGVPTLLAEVGAGLAASAEGYQGTDEGVADSFTPGG